MYELSDRVAKLLARGDVETVEALIDDSAGVPQEMARCVLALFERDPEAAIAHGRRVIELGAAGPGHAYVALGELLAGDIESALASSERALAVDPDPRHHNVRANVLLGAGQPVEAAAVSRQILATRPDDRDALLLLGAAAFQLGEYGEAITCNARAFDLDPTDRQPIRNLLTMFAELGRWLGAAAALELARKGTPPPDVAVALDVTQMQIVQLIASSFPERDVDEDSDRTVESLIANASKCAPRTRLAAVRALVDAERMTEARALVESIARTDATLSAADRAQCRYLEGLLAERAKDRETALDRYAAALAADPSRFEAAVNAISLHLEVGNDAAFAAIPAVLAGVDPFERSTQPSILFNEAIYLQRTGRGEQASALLARILELTRGEGELARLARQSLADPARPPPS